MSPVHHVHCNVLSIQFRFSFSEKIPKDGWIMRNHIICRCGVNTWLSDCIRNMELKY